ncbi:hypothetical protein EXS45_00435 [Candidatus Nomurabacteria bacterium]|nr:hypothetical protein [Candidatus Nomurabacteria bacterium]
MFGYLNGVLIYIFIFLVVLVGIIVGIVALFINRNKNNMDPNQMKPRSSAKDVLLNLGAFVALYTLVGNLIGLLFTIINTAYPKIASSYNYYGGSSSISWPVATLVVVFPIFVLLMWFLEKEYRVEPEKHESVIHKGLTYITLFVAGLVVVGDLITVIYYFIDGQELTTGFLLKVLVLLVIFSSLFIYYISDLRNKLTVKSRIFWRIFAGVIILGAIVWGFSVLGSPRTQRLYKYDEQKVNDLQNINNQITNFYSIKGTLPKNIEEMIGRNYYVSQVDPQNKKSYEYLKTNETTYDLCAEFNKASNDKMSQDYLYLDIYSTTSWSHPTGRHCFVQTINPNSYFKPMPMPRAF